MSICLYALAGIEAKAEALILPLGQGNHVLDFGADDSAVSAGHYLVASETIGSVEVTGSNLTYGENTRNNDLLKRDWISGTGNGQVIIRVPHGVWTVDMTLGSDDSASSGINISTSDYIVSEDLDVGIGEQRRVLFTDKQEGEIVIDLETEESWSIRSIELSNGRVVSDPGATSYQYDFGRIKSPVEPGYVGISGNSWGDVLWHTPVVTVQDYVTPLQGAEVDTAYNGLYLEGIANIGILAHKIPNGVWNVEVTASAAHFPVVDMTVRAEGNLILSDINVPVESASKFNKNVTVSDGMLDLEFRGTAWGIASLKLTKIDDIAEPDSLSSGRSIDRWGSNLVIDKSDMIRNESSETMLVDFEQFHFYANKKGGGVTPFVVKVDGDNGFTVVAVGTPRDVYELGYNVFPFSGDLYGGKQGVTLAPGETMAFGFLNANPDGTGSNSSVISFDLGTKEVYYSGGPEAVDSASVLVGQAPVMGTHTYNSLERDYKFEVDFDITFLGNAYSGNNIIDRGNLDEGKAVLIVDGANKYTNTTKHTSYLHLTGFSFYAARIGSPVTPAVFKVEYDGSREYRVVAIGDTIENYRLGENIAQFSQARIPPVIVEPGEVIAFGFLAARPDGSGVITCPIPFDSVDDHPVVHSGGPDASNSAKLALWAPSFVPGRYTNFYDRAYSFLTYYDATTAQLVADAENANISVAGVSVGRPDEKAREIPNYDTLISEGVRPLSIVRENAQARDGPPPYSTMSCRVTADNPRKGEHALLMEILAVPGEGKQRCEFKLGSFDWDIDDPESGYYHAFSFRFDSKHFGNPGSRFFTLNQITQAGSGVPGMARFHQVNKLQLKTSNDPSRVKLISQTLYGISSETKHTYQGQENTFEVAEFEKDVWYDIIIGSRYDLDGDGSGFLDIWYKKADEFEYTYFDGAPNGRVGFVGGGQTGGKSLGVYKGFDNQRYRIYYDEIRQGPIFSDVDIRNNPSLDIIQ
ncbi:heparin lyase I family protein [Rubellicoccus peritrichatus]|uniref:Uncharacterized protein n=1 Tax=Rubellicoccus peritrichatus TaxID=3080537 RepID=A0AAQ3LFG6_9BACT|nr:hypothetical protein [Puniceicoccus sp. CR14]WOO43584.1 hypothetical protein RZN69_10840 [Puniceicoccus sp. CR14]